MRRGRERLTDRPLGVSLERTLGSRSTMRRMARVQGLVYLVSGGWPLVHLRSFEAVTGPKIDDWLVRTVAGILVAIGAAEVWADRRDEVTPPLAVAGAGTAITLGSVAAWYAARGRIREVYFVDAAMEAALAVGWAVAIVHGRRRRDEDVVTLDPGVLASR
jgi:hypothetical protein